MKFTRRLFDSFLIAISVALSGPAIAWDGSATGTVIGMEMVAGAGGAPGNHDFRVHLSGSPTMCSGAIDPSWAYINVSDPNYKGGRFADHVRTCPGPERNNL